MPRQRASNHRVPSPGRAGRRWLPVVAAVAVVAAMATVTAAAWAVGGRAGGPSRRHPGSGGRPVAGAHPWAPRPPSPAPSGSASVSPAPSGSAPSSSPARSGTTSTSARATSPAAGATVPAGGCGAQVWQHLAACGWPGPGNTGYPAGQVFGRTVNGAYTVTQDGTVIDGWRVTGGIAVRAKNVTIRNSWITSDFKGANGSGVVNVNPGASATVEHNLIDGLNATHACVWHEGSAMTARFNECRGVNDGMFSWATTEGQDGTGDNFHIEDNWLHGFTTAAANGHIDGYQTEGARHGVIRHNTFDVSQDQDSAVAIWNSRKTSDDILVEHNLMAGGGFAVYAEDYSPSEASPAGGYAVTNIRFVNNVFSTIHFGCVGNWGVWYVRGAPTDGWNRSGNTVLETGEKIDTRNPTNRGSECR